MIRDRPLITWKGGRDVLPLQQKRHKSFSPAEGGGGGTTGFGDSSKTGT